NKVQPRTSFAAFAHDRLWHISEVTDEASDFRLEGRSGNVAIGTNSTLLTRSRHRPDRNPVVHRIPSRILRATEPTFGDHVSNQSVEIQALFRSHLPISFLGGAPDVSSGEAQHPPCSLEQLRIDWARLQRHALSEAVRKDAERRDSTE